MSGFAIFTVGGDEFVKKLDFLLKSGMVFDISRRIKTLDELIGEYTLDSIKRCDFIYAFHTPCKKVINVSNGRFREWGGIPLVNISFEDFVKIHLPTI